MAESPTLQSFSHWFIVVAPMRIRVFSCGFSSEISRSELEDLLNELRARLQPTANFPRLFPWMIWSRTLAGRRPVSYGMGFQESEYSFYCFRYAERNGANIVAQSNGHDHHVDTTVSSSHNGKTSTETVIRDTEQADLSPVPLSPVAPAVHAWKQGLPVRPPSDDEADAHDEDDWNGMYIGDYHLSGDEHSLRNRPAEIFTRMSNRRPLIFGQMFSCCSKKILLDVHELFHVRLRIH